MSFDPSSGFNPAQSYNGGGPSRPGSGGGNGILSQLDAGSLPIFNIEPVQLQFSVAADFVAAQVANNVIILALSNGRVLRIDLNRPEDIDGAWGAGLETQREREREKERERHTHTQRQRETD